MWGKLKENRRPGQKFSEWVAEAFPGLTARYASAAIWAAENSAYYAESLGGVSDPIEAQRLASEQQASQELPEELQSAEPPAPSIGLPKDTASKINKLAHRAQAGDEGPANAWARNHIAHRKSRRPRGSPPEAFKWFQGPAHGSKVDSMVSGYSR